MKSLELLEDIQGSANNLRLRVKLAEEGGFDEKEYAASRSGGTKAKSSAPLDDLKLHVDCEELRRTTETLGAL